VAATIGAKRWVEVSEQQVTPTTRAFSETVEVTVAEVDVVVRSVDGGEVPALAREDFVLLVDDVPTPISHFSVGGGERVARDAEPAVVGAAGATGEPAGEERSSGATWIVYFDGWRVPRARRLLVLREVRELLETAASVGDRFLVAAFEGDALELLVPLTEAQSEALSGIERLERRAPSLAFASPVAAAIARPLSTVERRERIRAGIDALRALLAVAGSAPAPAALLVASGGFDFEGLPPDESAGLRAEHARLLRALAARRLTAYTLFAGPERFAGSGADGPPALQAGNPGAASELAALAEASGGRAFVAAPDLDQRLRGVRQELARSYTLGFVPDARPGSSLAIEVRATRPGLALRHRSSIYLRTAGEIAGEEAFRTLVAAAPPPDPCGVGAEVGEARGARVGRSRLVPVALRIPLSALLLLEAGDRKVGGLDIHFALSASDGTLRELERRELELDLTPEEVERLAARGLRYLVEIAAPPGEAVLAVVVVDRTSGERCAARVELGGGR